MTESYPLIQKLQKRIGQTNSMLRRSSAGTLSDAAQSRILPGQARQQARKYSHSAQKMRYVNRENLGGMQPERLELIGKQIQSRYQDASSLITLKPAQFTTGSFWGEVDQTTFNQFSPEKEQPRQSNVMRQGTRIQKFNMFPKPGQTLEQFKQETPKRPIPQQGQVIPRKPKTSPGPAATPSARTRGTKPSLQPRSRLYSRVEEISDTVNQPVMEENPELEQSPLETTPERKTAPAQSETPKSKPKSSQKAPSAPPSASTVQRKPIKDAPPASKAKPVNAPATDEPVQAIQAEPAAEPAPEPERKIISAPVEDEAIRAAKPTQTQAPAAPETKKARPKPSPSAVQRIPAKAKAKTKPATENKRIPKANMIMPPVSERPNRRPAQEILTTQPSRPAARPLNLPAEERTPRQRPPAETSITVQSQTQRSTPPQADRKAAPPPKAEPVLPESAGSHQPTQQRAPQMIQRIPTPKAQKPAETAAKPTSRAQAKQPTVQQPGIESSAGLSAQTTAPKIFASRGLLPKETEPISMPVLKPRIPDGSENETPQTEKQTKISQDQQPSQKAPSPALTPATVQRMASLDIPSMEQQATGAISNLMGGSSSSTASPQASGRVDLEQIAEDIFPLVKRLIEIETDRVSRKF